MISKLPAASRRTVRWSDGATLVQATRCAEKVDAVRKAFDVAEIREACFSEDTLVLCEDGYFEKIMYVHVGDKVLSRCETTGEMAYKQVVKVHVHDHCKTQAIAFKHSQTNHAKFYGTGPSAVMYATDEHHFWVEGKGWTKVRDLEKGDELLTYNGEPTSIKYVIPSNCIETVYSLEVEDFHTYFVDIGVWVYDTNCAEKVGSKEIAQGRSIKS